MAHLVRKRFRFHLWHQFVRVLVLSFLLVPNVLTFFGIAYTASAKSLQNIAVKSIALYLPRSTRSASLQYMPRTGQQQNYCLNNVNPENWHITHQFQVSLASGSQITVTPSSSPNCDGSIGQTFNIPRNPTNSQCKLNVENGQISGCTGKQSNTIVRTARISHSPNSYFIHVASDAMGKSTSITVCLKSNVPGPWPPDMKTLLSLVPGSLIKVNTYASTDCSGPALQTNIPLTATSIGQAVNSTRLLDTDHKKITNRHA